MGLLDSLLGGDTSQSPTPSSSPFGDDFGNRLNAMFLAMASTPPGGAGGIPLLQATQLTNQQAQLQAQRNAMTQALIMGGMDPKQAQALAWNPTAAQMGLGLYQQKQGAAAASDDIKNQPTPPWQGPQSSGAPLTQAPAIPQIQNAAPVNIPKLQPVDASAVPADMLSQTPIATAGVVQPNMPPTQVASSSQGSATDAIPSQAPQVDASSVSPQLQKYMQFQPSSKVELAQMVRDDSAAPPPRPVPTPDAMRSFYQQQYDYWNAKVADATNKNQAGRKAMAENNLKLAEQYIGAANNPIVQAQLSKAKEEGKPVVIGQTELGQQIYGVPNQSGGFGRIDPNTGNIIPPGSPQSANGSPTVDQLMNAGLHGPDFLNAVQQSPQLGPKVANTVKMMTEGKLPPPSSFALAKPYWRNMIALASQYDPGFDQTTWTARNAARKEFNAGGQNSPAGQITAGNTAIQHLGQLYDLSPKIGGVNNAWILNAPLNAANQAYLKAENDPNFAQYNSTLGRYAEEVTKFYRGIGGNESDIQRSLANLSAAQSPAAREAAIKQEIHLMESKVSALQERWLHALGPGSADFPIIQNKSQSVIDKVEGKTANGGVTSSGVKWSIQ